MAEEPNTSFVVAKNDGEVTRIDIREPDEFEGVEPPVNASLLIESPGLLQIALHGYEVFSANKRFQFL